jgi:hypothetical protein
VLIVDAQSDLGNAANRTSPTHRQVPAYLKDDALDDLPRLRGRDLELVMGRAVCDWLGWRR